MHRNASLAWQRFQKVTCDSFRQENSGPAPRMEGCPTEEHSWLDENHRNCWEIQWNTPKKGAWIGK